MNSGRGMGYVDVSVSSASSQPGSGCVGVARALLRAGVDARLIETTSLHNGQVEGGCVVRLPGHGRTRAEVRELWGVLQPAGGVDGFKCAHVDVPGEYSGCILNYLGAEENERCPWAVRGDQSDLLKGQKTGRQRTKPPSAPSTTFLWSPLPRE